MVVKWKRPNAVFGSQAKSQTYDRTNTEGYGVMKVKERNCLVHRVAYKLTKGPFPVHNLICHSCDNPPCFNPVHLFVGTPKMNTQDMISKGRARYTRGQDRPGAKLSNRQAVEMREKFGSGQYSKTQLAIEYGIDPSVASRLIRGLAWRVE
jgi:hypothetical protein